MKTLNSLDDVDIQILNAPNTRSLIEGQRLNFSERVDRYRFLFRVYLAMLANAVLDGNDVEVDIWTRQLTYCVRCLRSAVELRGMPFDRRVYGLC